MRYPCRADILYNCQAMMRDEQNRDRKTFFRRFVASISTSVSWLKLCTAAR